VAVTFVFFSLMGLMFFLTTYLQSVKEYTPLEAGLRMAPIALGVILAARASVALTARFGTKLVVASGLGIVSVGLATFTTVGVDTEYLTIGGALVTMGIGMGLTMAPATDAIMGSLPPAKAGIGSAMNDVVRELGGTLGVAVLGSVVSTGYASGMDSTTAGMPHAAAEATTDSVGGAHEVAAELGGGAAAKLIAVADQSFVEAMNSAAGVAAFVTIAGALIALAFLPSRPGAEAPVATDRELLEPTPA
jgi:hypothetical protein